MNFHLEKILLFVSKGFSFYAFPKFLLVLLTTTHNETDVKINNMCVGTHSRYFSRLDLHEQSLETPTHVDSPALLKSVLLLVI